MHRHRVLPGFTTLAAIAVIRAAAGPADAGLLFYLSGDHGTTADYSAAAAPSPTYDFEVHSIADGARGSALECGNYQLLAYRAPGNIYAQRGTLSFFWRSRYPVGPTAFPIFRVAFADHSSWDMVFLRIDYNGRGFDAFVTDASLARTRVSVPLAPFPGPKRWTHLALAWDETRGIRFYVDGRVAAHADACARYDLALDQFGPHSRIISPHQVQSDYNFVRGGDIDELRIYDRMLDDRIIATLAQGARSATTAPRDNAAIEPEPRAARSEPGRAGGADSPYPRSLAEPAVRDEWYHRYGWDQAAPPELPPGRTVTVRKVEIHDAYDLKRWWWKANDGLRETTWPGVYNRSRLPGRNDYFQLPDWDCYVESGRAVTFALPNEPCNHLELAGAAWGRMELLPANTALETASEARAESVLFDRPQGRERTVHRLAAPLSGRKIRFVNVEQEQPIGELVAYHVSPGAEPAGTTARTYRLHPADDDAPSLAASIAFIKGRFPPDERTTVVAAIAGEPAGKTATGGSRKQKNTVTLPLVHILVPNTWDGLPDGLDGIAIDLPALAAKPTHGDLLPLNVQVRDPLWPLRNLLDFTFSVRPGEPKTLWLDLRDRLLPPGRPLVLAIASASGEFSAESMREAELRLIFKGRGAARAEHEADRFNQVRDAYAMLVEEHPSNSRLDLWNRFKGDLDDLLRVDPDHRLGRQYAAAAVPGSPRPRFPQPEPPAGVPLWAFRQVACLEQVHRFVRWYIDHRQVPYGDFGGGISDDVDLVNTWPGVALMGCEPEKVTASAAALLEAAYRNGMFTNGLPTIQTDELHTYEEGIDCLAQNLILDPGSPRNLERAMETARGIASITGVNAAGHRHIRSSYYSGNTVAVEDPWGYAKPYSYLVLQVPQLLIEHNGNPAAKKLLVELADGLLAHHRPGSPRGASVPAIHFVTDREDDVGRGYFPWHVFWGAYRHTGDRRYLAPILDGGMTSLAMLSPNVLDLLDLRSTWGARLQAGERSQAPASARDAGRPRARTDQYRASDGAHFAWQLTGDKSHLEQLYAAQIQTCAALEYINTEGSLWTDRVGVPTAELQRARLGGVALLRNALYPGHAVSWKFAPPARGESVAILIPRATATALEVIAFNCEPFPVEAAMTGWNVDPGRWEIAQGIDTDGDGESDAALDRREVAFERSRSIHLVFPPRATTVVTLALRSPGTPCWQRPDLGIGPEDVEVRDGAVRVRLHSLGSVSAPAMKIALHDARGGTLATETSPAIPAPIDLEPKIATIVLRPPPDASLHDATVTIDPDEEIEEITRLNNSVHLP